MNDFKQVKVKNFRYDDHRHEIQRRINKLNQKYDKHGLRIYILTEGQLPQLDFCCWDLSGHKKQIPKLLS